MLMVVAPASMAASIMRHRKSSSERPASSQENSTSSTWLRARFTARTACSTTSSGCICSLCCIWIGEVAIKVWIRPQAARPIAGGARTKSLLRARGKAANGGIPDAFGNGLDRLEVTLAGNRETRFDHIHPELFQHLGNTKLFVLVHGGARALLAIPESGIENDQMIACRHRRAPVKNLDVVDGRQYITSPGPEMKKPPAATPPGVLVLRA